MRLTLPIATAVVAMSRRYSSPPVPLAPRHNGFVPSAGTDALVGYMIGEVFVKAIP